MAGRKVHISLVAIPDEVISTLSGIYDVLNSFSTLASLGAPIDADGPFEVEIVAEAAGPVPLVSGLPIQAGRAIADVETTDIVIVPSVVVNGATWEAGRYPALVAWLKDMYARGATLCSACSGVFLLAETGLLDGNPATVHWSYADKFRRSYPAVPVSPEKVLVISGARGEFISSGASTSWHDLVLHLVARHAGAAAALAVARFYALEWHREGLAPYIVFMPQREHGDAAVLDAQDWLAANHSLASPVDEMVRRSGLAERTFKRRFSKATGKTPIAYVQALRVEEAKRRLERTAAPIDEIGWNVGYEDPAFFRRLFKRAVGMTPGAYRRKFNLPDYGG